MLGHHTFHFRKATDYGAHLVDVFVSFLKRNRGWQRRSNPEIAFLKLWQELQAKQTHG